MEFLHIHTTDNKDGAAITAYRFHRALLSKGHGSQILCGRKYAEGSDTISVMPGRFGWITNAALGLLFNHAGLQSFGYPSSISIKYLGRIRKKPDVIILRNPHGWYLSLGILPWLAEKAPIIWRLPDMWALTGHCAYSYDCQRWLTGCGKCPHLYEYPELLIDTTHFLWLRKKKIYQRLKDKIIFVSPSKWLKGLVEQSPLTKGFRCEYIPPGIDLNIFRPSPKEQITHSLGIGKDDKVVMFSSFKFKHKRKGPDILNEIIGKVAKQLNNPLALILVGKGAEKLNLKGIKVVNAGFASNDLKLAEFYNAADVYLCLSKADNLPNALIEAAACGLPIVTFDSGGCKEALEDNLSGYVAKDKDGAVSALVDILQNDEKRKEFSLHARAYAESNFSMETQVERYVSLAKEMIRANKPNEPG